MYVANHPSPKMGYPKVAANQPSGPQEEEGGRFQKFNSFGQHFAFTSVSNPYDRSRFGMHTSSV